MAPKNVICLWFENNAHEAARDFDRTPDGQRILAIVPRVDASQLPLNVVVNWPRAVGR